MQLRKIILNIDIKKFLSAFVVFEKTKTVPFRSKFMFAERWRDYWAKCHREIANKRGI